jgi:hypothetical protein
LASQSADVKSSCTDALMEGVIRQFEANTESFPFTPRNAIVRHLKRGRLQIGKRLQARLNAYILRSTPDWRRNH